MNAGGGAKAFGGEPGSVIRRAVRTLALGGALGGVALTVLLVACQRSLIYYPRAYVGGALERADAIGAVRIEFATREGSQTAFYLPPPAAEPERIWLVCAGNGSLALDWVPFTTAAQARFPGSGFLLFDYPGYGLCEGRPGPASIEESLRAAMAALEERLPSGGEGMKRNVAGEGAAGEGAERSSSGNPTWAVLGHSIGCAAALVAADIHGIREAVLVAPFTSMQEMARHVLGRPFDLLVRHRFDNRERLSRLVPAGARVAVLHGTSDDLIPVEMARILRDEFAPAVTLVEIPGAGHNDIVSVAEDRILDAMSDVASAAASASAGDGS